MVDRAAIASKVEIATRVARVTETPGPMMVEMSTAIPPQATVKQEQRTVELLGLPIAEMGTVAWTTGITADKGIMVMAKMAVAMAIVVAIAVILAMV